MGETHQDFHSGALNEMKRFCLSALIVLLLPLGACAPAKDVPAYTGAQVLEVAKAFSPLCRALKSAEPGP